MTAIIDMASIPPWRQALLDKKRRGDDILDDRSFGSSGQDETSSRNRVDFLSKKQIGENTYFYSHSSSVSASNRDYNKNDTVQIERIQAAKPSNSDIEVLVRTKEVAEWNLPNQAEIEPTSTQTNNMVSSSNHTAEVNANGPTPSLGTAVNGVLVDEERISSVHDNPFMKTFGLKRQLSAEIRSSRLSSGSLTNDVTYKSHIGNNQTESTNDSGLVNIDNTDSINEVEEEYHPGSGFVHKILDKFALLTAKEEAHHPTAIHITKRSSSLEDLVDDRTKKSRHRISAGDEVFTSSSSSTVPKSNFQYQSKAKSVENLLTNKPYTDRHHSETYENRHRAGSDLRDGRYRSGSELEGRHRSSSRSHPAPDVNLAREDIIIIDTTPSPRPVEDDPMKHAHKIMRKPRTSSSERLAEDELPKPNTVKAQRKKFELKQKQDEASSQKRKKNKALSVPGADNSTTVPHANNDLSGKDKVSDNIDELLKQNGDASKDSSFDTDTSVDVIEQEKDYENPVYDAIRLKLRHVKPRTEEEITYSWKRGSGSDWLENTSLDLGPVGPPKTSILNKNSSSSSKVENNHSSMSVSNNKTMGNNTAASNNSVSMTASVPVLENSQERVPVAISKLTNTSVVKTPRSTDPNEKISSTTKTSTQLKTTSSSSSTQPKITKSNTQASSMVTATQHKPSAAPRPRQPPPRKPKVETTRIDETTSLSSSSSVTSTTVIKVADSVRESTKEEEIIMTTTTTNVPVSEINTMQIEPVKAPEPKVTAVSEPTVAAGLTKPAKANTMVMVGPAVQNDYARSDFRSRNRFDASSTAGEDKTVKAGKSWFYEAGKFKANPEGVKRQSNSSRSSGPVPKKRAAPVPPGVPLLNLTDDSLDSSHTPQSNIDDYITNGSDTIPVTDFNIPYADANGGASVGGGPDVPRLDLTGITSESGNKTSARDPYYRGPRKVGPCNYQFSGANVVVGKGLLQAKKKAQKLKLCFDDTLTSTYEYPSEELMLEEYLAEHPDEKELVFTLDDYIANDNESSDDMDPTTMVEINNVEENNQSSLKSTPGIGGNSSGLSSYRAKFQMDYEFGMEFARQAEREQEDKLRQEQDLRNKTDDGDLVPAEEEDLLTFSTSGTSDMLF